MCPGSALSGGQQQRLCIARAIAVQPDVVLMDEPCSALDPVSTLKVEELMRELRLKYTIVLVTHNMQQAVRVSDTTMVLLPDEKRVGHLIEVGQTETSSTIRKMRDRRLRQRSHWLETNKAALSIQDNVDPGCAIRIDVDDFLEAHALPVIDTDLIVIGE